MDDLMNTHATRRVALHIMAILSESWHLVPGLKWPMFKRGLLVFFTAFPSLFLALYADIHFGLTGFIHHTFVFITRLIVIIVVTRLWVPVLMFGVRRAIGLPIDLRLIKSECSKVESTLFQLIIIYVVLSNVSVYLRIWLLGSDFHWSMPGSIYLVIWSLILIVIFIPIIFFAFPLVITQKLTVYSALASSYKKMLANWALVIGSVMVLFILMAAMIGALFLLGHFLPPAINAIFIIVLAIILLPMPITMGGVLFRDLYGLKRKKIVNTSSGFATIR